ncbi:hypothetical protein [Pseudomonas syringae]|uniref:hypothetical protein n=1 Tax=Pseudomonas syringae TaxID=317 RepID=UPI000A7BBFD8|nr:hypothetical protein [Pseudomonas syringae]
MFRRAEHAVMPTLDLIQPITDAIQKIGIGPQDIAFKIELDHRLGTVNGSHQRVKIKFQPGLVPGGAFNCGRHVEILYE